MALTWLTAAHPCAHVLLQLQGVKINVAFKVQGARTGLSSSGFSWHLVGRS